MDKTVFLKKLMCFSQFATNAIISDFASLYKGFDLGLVLKNVATCEDDHDLLLQDLHKLASFFIRFGENHDHVKKMLTTSSVVEFEMLCSKYKVNQKKQYYPFYYEASLPRIAILMSPCMLIWINNLDPAIPLDCDQIESVSSLPRVLKHCLFGFMIPKAGSSAYNITVEEWELLMGVYYYNMVEYYKLVNREKEAAQALREHEILTRVCSFISKQNRTVFFTSRVKVESLTKANVLCPSGYLTSAVRKALEQSKDEGYFRHYRHGQIPTLREATPKAPIFCLGSSLHLLAPRLQAASQQRNKRSRLY